MYWFEIDLCSKCTEQSNKRRDVEHRAKQNEEKIKILNHENCMYVCSNEQSEQSK